MPFAVGASNSVLFKQIGARLPKSTTAFLIGGENLRARGLRHDMGHDHDFVMPNDQDFDTTVSTLTDIGFQHNIGVESNSGSDPAMDQEQCYGILSLDWLMF